MIVVEKVFLDTNVLVYAHDRSEATKGPQAQALLVQLLASGRPLISTQVLAEFYWTATRKIPQPLTHAEATAEVQRLVVLTSVVPITSQVVERGLEAVRTHGLAFWDAQIFAAAVMNGAAILVSEDFQDGRTVEGVTFLNPFALTFDMGKLLGP
jgi:predicted nucleic acid-binding protein